MMKIGMLNGHSLPGPDSITRIVLENGITVLIRENFTSPAVVVQGLLRGGAMLENAGQTGIASFHSAMLTRGTKNYSYETLFDVVEGMGASLDVGSGRHHLSFGSKSLAEDLPLIFSLLGEVLQKPEFPPEQIEKVRIPMLTGLKMREESTRHMASLKFNELLYADHPYAFSINGYQDTITSITRDDIMAYQNLIGPRGGIIAVAGAVSVEDALKYLDGTFAGWQNPHQAEEQIIPPVSTQTDIRETFYPVPGKSQSDLILGFIGPSRLSADFQAARLANSILGVFGMYGRLGDSVRQREGLAYYSYSSLLGGIGPGAWRVNAGVAPANVNKAIALILEEIQGMVQEPVSEEELNDNKSFYKGQVILALETNEGVAGSLVSMEQYDLGLDYLLRYADLIDEINAEDILEVSQKYLHPEAYTLAVAGPKA